MPRVSITNIIIVIVMALTTWPPFTRLVRSEALRVREADYVALARISDVPGWLIAIRHVRPNVMNGVIVIATLDVGRVILLESGLSFLGCGVRPATVRGECRYMHSTYQCARRSSICSATCRRRGMTYLFISHDLAIAEFMADRVGVMYLGRLVEIGGKRELFSRSLHPYTHGMLDLARANETRARGTTPVVRGEIPSPSEQHKGCPYSARCPAAIDVCRNVPPFLRAVGGDHQVACHRSEELESVPLVGGTPIVREHRPQPGGMQ